MTPNYLTLAEAAKELSQQLERPVTERQVLEFGVNEQVSIFAKTNGDARLPKANPVDGKPNEFQAVEGSLVRLTINDLISLVWPSTRQNIEHNNELVSVITFKIAEGETPPETTLADYRISKDSIDEIVKIVKIDKIEHDAFLVAVLEWEGRQTDYNYWLNLEVLTPHEAIMLLNFCHPQKPLNTFSSEHRYKLDNELRQAERAQTAGKVPANASPLDWYNWAKENNFTIPTQFNAILCSPQIELNVSPQNLDNADKPWLIANSSDPVADYTWYIPARYFARETLKTEPTLLAKKDILAGRVNTLFKNFGIKKRGGKNDFDDSTIKKAFSNVNFG